MTPFYVNNPMILWPFVAACIVALICIWLRVLWPFRKGSPKCGKCKYSVEGLTTLTCPECGADFRDVGMLAPHQRERMAAATFVALWTLLLPLPAIVASAYLIRNGPKHEVSWQMLQLAPKSAAYGDLHVTGTTGGGHFLLKAPVRLDHLLIVGENALGQWWQISVKLGSLHYDTIAAAGVRKAFAGMHRKTNNRAIDRTAILQWWASLSADTTQQSVQDEADELVKVIQIAAREGTLRELRAGDFSAFTAQGPSWTTLERAAGWFVIAIAGLWVLLWLLGISMFIVVQRRRVRLQANKIAEL